jgi:hemolysin activation/secretion protein
MLLESIAMVWRCRVFGFCLVIFASVSYAQVIPEGAAARQLIREQEQRQQQELLLKDDVDVRIDRPSMATAAIMFPPDESPCFVIDDIALAGQRLSEFSGLLDRFYRSFSKEMKNELGGEYESAYALLEANKNYVLGRCMGSVSINNVMARLQNQLIEKGYVTSRIVAGSQELSSGVLTLTLIPGVVSDIRFSDQKKRANVLPMNSNQLLNLRDIEQALESMRRLPSVTADINIVPATGENAQPGDSDLDITWEQGFPLRTVLSLNNSGTESTGELQGSASFSYDNLFGLHDITTLSIGHDVGGAEPLKGGTDSYSFGYSVPFGYWNIALNASQSGYFQTIQGAFVDYQYRGESRNANLDISRLVYRDKIRKLTLGLNTWYRDSKNFINDAEVFPQRRRTAGIELNASYRQFVQQATFSGAITYRRGTGAFGALAAPEDAFGEGASRPQIFKANLQLNVPFTLVNQRFQYSTEWRKQYTRERLVTQDRFSIGGRYTVRGFDGENTLLSETGWLVRNDLTMNLGGSAHSIYLGVDYGKVGGFSEASQLGNELTGAVIGFKGTFFGRLSYDLLAGRSLNKPEGFNTDSGVVQFSLNWVY